MTTLDTTLSQKHRLAMGSSRFALHWFRRDLRVAGNRALKRAASEHEGRVLGVFFVDPGILSRLDFCENRFSFFLRTLAAIRDELRASGSDLLVLRSSPREGFASLRAAIAKNLSFTDVYYSRDYEPYAGKRDAEVTAFLEKDCAVRVHSERDHLLLEPDEILQNSGKPYQIYSPFARRWFKSLHSGEIQARLVEDEASLRELSRLSRGTKPRREFALTWATVLGKSARMRDELDHLLENHPGTLPLPAAGSGAAYRALMEFGKKRLASYGRDREFPALNATSHLSPYLKTGSISVGQVIAELGLQRARFSSENSGTKFLKELVWREFYYHVLYRHPRVESEAFQERFRDLKWPNDQERFEAWKAGRTGFPIVDAGMRELLSTGFMHNRVRMIVASFLVKDLNIDWRWGERWFMRNLVDGDLAANNGGWQWAASTGCDPVPYFRVFNPELQSRKFDPKGEYIRKYIPELKKVPDRRIHAPDGSARPKEYPKPIVDHSAQRLVTLRLYDGARS